ncbi:amyloid-beta A4 precursor protein-binding family A member 2 [Sardina pilchardus]|uniref:amyloid-beta A4 precursor protein-binding family A member 2 n=1 Tax=Sardina pilchardus TaxID=27697 RepID=UPI002E130E4E
MKPAKAHRKKLRAEPPSPTPSHRHHRSAMETKQQHSNAMETKQHHSNTMETKQQHSSTMDIKQLPSNAMDTKQLPSNAMDTKQLPSNAMDTKQLPSNAMETKLPNCSTMETKAPKAVAMRSETPPTSAQETPPPRITGADDWSSDEGPPPDQGSDEDSLSEYDNDESYMEGMDCHEGTDAGAGSSVPRGPDTTAGHASGTSASGAVSPAVQQDPEALDYTHTHTHTHTQPLTEPTFIQAPMAEDEEDRHTHAEGSYRGRADGGQGSRSRPYPRPRDAERRSWHIQGHEPRPEVTVDLADEVRRSLSMSRHMEQSHDPRVTPDRPRARSNHPRPVSLPLVLADDLERASANMPPRGRNRQRQSAHYPDHAAPAHLYSQPNPDPPEHLYSQPNPDHVPEHLYSQPNPDHGPAHLYSQPNPEPLEHHPDPTHPNRTDSNHKPPQPAKKNASFPSFVDVPGPCEPEDLVDGIIFAANYLGSTQLLSDRNPSKSVRMTQAQEAVEQVKRAILAHVLVFQSSSEENHSLIEVDLFISTKAIKVLNADTQETIMDNALRTISYIADIGSVVVLMARRRMSHSASLDCTDPAAGPADSRKQYRMVCYVFESEDAQLIAQSIGQAFSMAYQEFLRSNGINPKDLSQKEYSDIINTQEMYNDDLIHFSNSDNCKELRIEKQKGEMLGVVIVESGWGSILPTVIVACVLNSGAAARSGRLSVGDQIMAVNDTSLVGLPLATCQSIIKGLKHQVQVKLSVVSCPPVTTVLIKRPDLQYQLGFSVQNGIICSLMRGGIAERGGVRVGHRIIEINGQSVVAMAHEKIVHALSVSVGEINMKTMPAVMFRLLTGQETPVYI